MNAISLLRLTTTILSVFTVPFAFYLAITFVKERLHSNFRHLELNYSMQLSTFLIAVGSAVSGTLSFLLLIGYDFEQHMPMVWVQSLFNGRNILFNLAHLVLCVILTFEHMKGVNHDKN